MIFDSKLEPWILEINMSPAMAHRSLEQNQLIKNMCCGLLDIAVYPHFLEANQQFSLCKVDFDIGDAVSDNVKTSYCGEDTILATGGGYTQSSTVTNWEVLVSMDTASAALTSSTVLVEKPTYAEPVELISLVNDWDEILPPDGVVRPPKVGNGTGGALLRKYSGIPGRNTGSQTTERRGSGGGENYFQKFVNVAANAALTTASTKDTSSRNISNMVMVGMGVNEAQMERIDSLCNGHQKLMALQMWWKKMVLKVRQYYKTRNYGAVQV